MKNKIIITTTLVLLALIGVVSCANAAIIPSLSLSYVNGNSVTITVNADPNASIQLYYLSQYNSSPNYTGTLGYTNSSGYFYTTVNSNYDNIPENSIVYVVVDGTSSQEISWPSYNNYVNPSVTSSVSFSQNNISLAVGQSVNVTISGGYNNGYYLSSASSLVGTGINGNDMSIYGNADGTANLIVCSENSSSCGTLTVNVYGTAVNYYPQYYPITYYQYPYPNQYPAQYPISLSQNSIYLNAGQNSSVTIYGNGGYYVSNDSNSSIASVSINGSTLNVYAYNAGNSDITVCQNSGSCATLYVVVAYNPPPPPTPTIVTGYYRYPQWTRPFTTFFRRAGMFFRI